MYRGDMCRVALLWKYGGYYFDLDIEVIRPIDLSLDVEFASSFEYPRHGQPDERGTIMGTEAMFHAYNESENRGRTVMLEEAKGNSKLGLKDWSTRLMSSCLNCCQTNIDWQLKYQTTLSGGKINYRFYKQ